MTFRRLCWSLALLLLLHPPTATAVDALTTTVEEANTKKRLEAQISERAKALERSKATLIELDNGPAVTKTFGSPRTGRPGMPFLAPAPVGEGLGDDEKHFAEGFQAAELAVSIDEENLADARKQLEKATHELKPIPISASVQINSGSSSSAVVPCIDANASFPISKSLDGQILLSIKPDPAAGTTADVAQSIRMSTGVLSADFGLNYNRFWKGDDAPQGPLGVEARVGLPVAYQRASSTDPPPSGQSSTSSTDFGLLSPELKVSVWLKYALLGYKYVYYFAFGNSNAVYQEIDRTGSHRIYLAAKLQALSGSDKTPFYVEASYTSGKNGFSGGAFSFAVSKSLSWDPR